ncbi:SDR family oxidoreductase [Pseudomonas sp. NPDC007930]|uniref:SDR family NAD(P)-dependent oxidoreductase n=1 Tax=Pseudomonas sp. NPDC007930 TaxID=3364417 RepID=UPI0036ECC580
MSIPQPPVYWVTGASGALGSAIALHLHRSGAQVVASSREITRLPVPTELWWSLAVDVAHEQAVGRAVGQIVERYGRVDGLVTCTTGPGFGDFHTLQDDVWATVLDTKLMGSVRAVRAVLPGMLARHRGSIVMLTGRGGSVPPPRHLPGSCANAALNLLAQGLATQYGEQGIRVNTVAPGPIASPRLEQMKAGVAAATSALGGPGRPEDVAAAVAFLLSEQAAHITGICLPVDGGRPR